MYRHILNEVERMDHGIHAFIDASEAAQSHAFDASPHEANLPSMTTSGKEAWWRIAESIAWICRRDLDSVALLRSQDEKEAIAHAMLRFRTGVRVTQRADVPESVTPSQFLAKDAPGAVDKLPVVESRTKATKGRKGAGIVTPEDATPESAGEEVERFNVDLVHADDQPSVIQPDEALAELLAAHRNGQIEIWGRRIGAMVSEPVLTVELIDLTFRIIPGAPGPAVGLWMAQDSAMSWTSLQCRSADVMALWPASRRKTVAAVQTLLSHLEHIMGATPRPTKDEARERCKAEVPAYYHQAFEHAWRLLGPLKKRTRGKHGPRAINRKPDPKPSTS